MKARFLRLWQWIKANQLFVFTCTGGFVLYSLISISKHLHFDSTGFDLVIFDQAVRHYSELTAPASSFRGYTNLLGDHFHPILALLAPLYWLYNSPTTLLLAQALLIISACFPIYLYAKKKLDHKPAMFLIIAFILNAALLRAVYFDFHEIAFAIPLIAWAIYFIDIKRWLLFFISITLLLLVKEDMSLLVAFFGIYLLILKQYKYGFATLAIGILWFFLAIKVFIPYFAGDSHTFNYWSYDQLGSDLASSIIAIVKNPVFALSLLFIPIVKVMTLLKTFGVLLGLTFFSPIILLAIPLILERFLSSTENYWQFNYHYGATLTPILIMAVSDSLNRMRRWHLFKAIKTTRVITIATKLVAIVAIVLFIASPMRFIAYPSNYIFTQDEKSGYKLLERIPNDASVCTTNHIAPHLGRHHLTLIGFDGRIQKLTCEYIIVSNQLDQSTTLTQTIQAVQSDGYDLIARDSSWELYKK